MQRRSALNNISPFALVDLITDAVDMIDAGHDRLNVQQCHAGVPRRAVEIAGDREGADMLRDIMDDDKRGEIRFNMLGLSRKDVKVMVEDNMLVIRGEHSKEDGEGTGGSDDGWWKERSMSSYNMRLVLPNVGDKSKVRAELKNGVLFVIVPKTEVKHKVIEGAEQRGEWREEDGRKKVEDRKGRRWMKNVTACNAPIFVRVLKSLNNAFSGN